MNLLLDILKKHPLFRGFSEEDLKEFSNLFQTKRFEKGEILVKENDPVDSILFILDGNVSITKQGEILAVLRKGENLGLSEKGFFSETGFRTATATALTSGEEASLSIKLLISFLEKHESLLSLMQKKADLLLKMNLIKQIEPFQEIDPKLLEEIAEKIEPLKIDANQVVFREEDLPDYAYLLLEGKVDIFHANEKLAELEAPALFGEVGLFLGARRNATVQTAAPCVLYRLHKEELKLLLKQPLTHELVLSTTLQRFRPKKKEGITVHQRQDSKKHMVVILKNEKEGTYFKTEEEGLFIWDLLNGENSLKEISISFFFQYKKIAVEDIEHLILQLMHGGFVNLPATTSGMTKEDLPFWRRALDFLAKVLTIEYSIKGIDQRLSRLYDRIGFVFFTKTAKIVMTLLLFTGFFAFFHLLPKMKVLMRDIEHFYHIFFWTYIALIPSVMLHEMAHALTTKSYGFQVHRMGVGWFWFGPIAFTDTSDMWLGSSKQRIFVNLAGIYINCVIAAFLALTAYCTYSFLPTASLFLWLLAFSNFSISFYNLDPILELDGYYILSDSLDTPRLRARAVQWLIESRKFSKEHIPEISYWAACLLFIFLSAAVGYFIQNTILIQLFPKQLHHFFLTYLRWGLFVLILVLSFLSIYFPIARQAKKPQ